MQTIKSYFYRGLIFFRVVDEYDSNISITNIALIITLYKLATTQNASMTDVGAVMIALANYSYKKTINKPLKEAAKFTNDILQKAEELNNKE